MAQRLKQTAADVSHIARLRKDTIPVEKQDLESWYRTLNELGNDFIPQGMSHFADALDELRDEIYAYLT